VVDNYATHKHPAVRAWLDENPRITLHFTPTSGSWMNMVEIFFGIITRQAIRRGTFTSVKDLIGAIGAFIDGVERTLPAIRLDQTRRPATQPLPPRSKNLVHATLTGQPTGSARKLVHCGQVGVFDLRHSLVHLVGGAVQCD